jgi:uncharacterized phage infection (PIP) family protein YhgE
VAFGIAHLTHLIEQIAAQLSAVQTELSQLPDKARFDALEALINTMAQSQADLDSALDSLGTAMDTGIQQILTAVNDIATRVGPSIDLSAEVARVQKAASDIATAAGTVQGLDVAPVPPTPPTP